MKKKAFLALAWRASGQDLLLEGNELGLIWNPSCKVEHEHRASTATMDARGHAAVGEEDIACFVVIGENDTRPNGSVGDSSTLLRAGQLLMWEPIVRHRLRGNGEVAAESAVPCIFQPLDKLSFFPHRVRGAHIKESRKGVPEGKTRSR